MKATHWSANLDPEDWTDNPASSPEDAAREWIEDGNGDDADSDRDDILHGALHRSEVDVHGFTHTDTPDWYLPTGETVTVVCEIDYYVKGTK